MARNICRALAGGNGAEIDSHDMVMRFNGAPTKAGRRTLKLVETSVESTCFQRS